MLDLDEWLRINYKHTNKEESTSKWNKSWAFDFSGWLGSLDFNKEHVKKFMIVGLEPHVKDYDFQIVYGLSDKAPGDVEKRFSINDKDIINQEKDDIIQYNGDGDLIWSNLFRIMANEDLVQKVVKERDVNALLTFLEQFYITDLCHFAPKGAAGEIRNIKGWANLRSEVARKYLKREIEIINPEIVIAQGVGVFHELLKILGIQHYITYMDENKRLVLTADHKDMRILSIPHFGSVMMKNTFWSKHLDRVRKLLNEHKLI